MPRKNLWSGKFTVPTGILETNPVEGEKSGLANGAGAANAGREREAETARKTVKKRIVQVVKETLKKIKWVDCMGHTSAHRSWEYEGQTNSPTSVE